MGVLRTFITFDILLGKLLLDVNLGGKRSLRQMIGRTDGPDESLESQVELTDCQKFFNSRDWVNTISFFKYQPLQAILKAATSNFSAAQSEKSAATSESFNSTLSQLFL